MRVYIEGGLQRVVELYCTHNFFGEISFITASGCENAKALEPSSLLYWSAKEVEKQITRQPKLGMALIQIRVAHCLDLKGRLQSLAFDKMPQRIERSLIHLADRLGNRSRGDAVCIPPFTHQLLSEYIGASRSTVTLQMNRLRRKGIVRYSRGGIEILIEALREHVCKQQE